MRYFCTVLAAAILSIAITQLGTASPSEAQTQCVKVLSTGAHMANGCGSAMCANLALQRGSKVKIVTVKVLPNQTSPMPPKSAYPIARSGSDTYGQIVSENKC
jgi:hypothetical protein